MIHIPTLIKKTLTNRRAQILLPAVMLAPIFILVVYLLFETSKLSMTKVRQQFALDNGAYSQMSATSGYLNAMAQINGPLPYRVMQDGGFVMPLKKKEGDDFTDLGDLTVFDAFYKAGAFPAAGPNAGKIGKDGAVQRFTPSPESNDWGFKYYPGTRKDWLKEDPTPSLGRNANSKPTNEKYDKVNAEKDANAYLMTDQEIADNYFFGATTVGKTTMKDYLTIFLRTGSIYASQTYSYQDTIKNSRMFRESYYLNTKDCARKDCGKQAAETLDRYELETKPFEISEDMRFYVTADWQGSTSHSKAFAIPINPGKILKTKLFQFAYLTPESRTRLKQLNKGVVLKQKFLVPENRFNINLVERYHPYVRNSVSISCPRSNNNCVWPNPISKYSVKVGL